MVWQEEREKKNIIEKKKINEKYCKNRLKINKINRWKSKDY